jgi:hypothetical protein
MRARVYGDLVPSTRLTGAHNLTGSLAAAAIAAESYDLTNCAASTVTTVSATEELTVMSVNTKGITRSNSANKAFDSATFECPVRCSTIPTARR